MNWTTEADTPLNRFDLRCNSQNAVPVMPVFVWGAADWVELSFYNR